MFEIKGKVAIVTGAADGIGLATVEALLRKGAKVVMSDINADKLLAESLKLKIEYHNDVTHKVTDVTQKDQVEELVQFAVDTYGHLDIMVANAGVAAFHSAIQDDAYDIYKWVMSVNMDGVFLSDTLAIKQMVKQGTGGAVVNISSIEGFIGDPQLSAYNSTKGGVRILTKSLALEFAKNNIRVNSIHPGYITTGMINEQTMGVEGYEHLKSLHPLSEGLGRIGLPEEIALGVIFEIENSFMTGTELLIDGGYTAQ